MGKGGQLPEETLAKGEAKNEKELQKQICSYLRLKGIEPIVSRTDKRTTNNVGTPDILGAFCGEQAGHVRIFAFAFECKMPNKQMRPQQIEMRKLMTTSPNAWSHRLITHLNQVIEFLRERGI